jgi:leucyl-tRNA synthetase
MMIAPFAPHIAEELWAQLGHTDSVHVGHWPAHQDKYLVRDTVTIVVQVNGKVRAELQLAPDVGEQAAIAAALDNENVQKYIDGKPIKKQIYVRGRLVNLVV